MTINTRPAIAEDMDWLAEVFTHSLRDAITFARGSWDFAREDAQFRAQLQLSDTRVIQMESDDVGFVTMRTLGMKLLELHTLCIRPDRQGLGIGTRTMQDVMRGRFGYRAVRIEIKRARRTSMHVWVSAKSA